MSLCLLFFPQLPDSHTSSWPFKLQKNSPPGLCLFVHHWTDLTADANRMQRTVALKPPGRPIRKYLVKLSAITVLKYLSTPLYLELLCHTEKQQGQQLQQNTHHRVSTDLNELLIDLHCWGSSQEKQMCSRFQGYFWGCRYGFSSKYTVVTVTLMILEYSWFKGISIRPSSISHLLVTVFG